MAASCRFAFAVHVLAVLALRGDEAVTSEKLAQSVNTNAVVIRRILADLRRAGLVCTCKGAGGGAWLTLTPEEIRLDEVYRAMESCPSFSLHPHQPNQRCLVGRRIEEVLTGVFNSAQAAFEEALSRRTLAEVLEDVSAAPGGSR